jgi:hypothetical protein
MTNEGQDGATATITNEFAVLQQAGLSVYQFAHIMDVTAPTVYGWVSGKNKPSRHLKPKVEHALARLGQWVELGKLPRSDTSRLGRQATADKIKAVLSQ